LACILCGSSVIDEENSLDIINSIREEAGLDDLIMDESLEEFATLLANRCDGGHWDIASRTDVAGYDYIGITYVQGWLA